MPKWLLDRLFVRQDQPTPQFAFQGTVRWMRALAILADGQTFSPQAMRLKYQGVQRRRVNQEADTLAFEMLLMAIHNLAALAQFSAPGLNKYEVVRSAVVAWYYCVYYSAKAMIAASSGADPQTHSKTARVWQSDIVDSGFAVIPFSFVLSDATAATVDREIAHLRQGNAHDLNTDPSTVEHGLGAALSYLRGTAEYVKAEVEEEVRNGREFRALGVQNFRTAAARTLRDDALRRETVNFLIQAFRYRGKANYRDSIYLTYGEDRTPAITVFVSDLKLVAERFVVMASTFVARRVERGSWQLFVNDVQENLRVQCPIALGAIT